VPAVELRKIAGRGGLEHVSYGLYRFEEIPRSGRDQLMEAVLRVGRGAYLTHDAVLEINDLGLVNPRRIRVGTARRVRKRLPDHIALIHRRLPDEDLTVYEGIPSATIRRALLDCVGMVMKERLLEVAHEAARRGLLRRYDVAQVIAELGGAV